MNQLLVCAFAAVCACVWGYPDGAPEEACGSMVPEHFFDPTPGGNDRYAIDVVDNEDGSFEGGMSNHRARSLILIYMYF